MPTCSLTSHVVFVAPPKAALWKTCFENHNIKVCEWPPTPLPSFPQILSWSRSRKCRQKWDLDLGSSLTMSQGPRICWATPSPSGGSANTHTHTSLGPNRWGALFLCKTVLDLKASRNGEGSVSKHLGLLRRVTAPECPRNCSKKRRGQRSPAQSLGHPLV